MGFHLSVYGDDHGTDTRSILPEESIEDKVTDATLASYDAEGKLVNVLYYDRVEASMMLYVSGKSSFNVYALVNMGDMTDAFPSEESELAELVYRFESYEDVSRRGIPMCGVLENCTYEEGAVRTVPLERLFAKVNVRILHTGLNGGQTEQVYAYNLANKSLYIRQANRKMCPFAPEGSRAETASDLLELSDRNPDLADTDAYKGSLTPSQLGPGMAYVKDTTVVLYVPENRQGCLLPGNEDPFEKVAERISDIDGTRYDELCTFLEYNAAKPNNGAGFHGDLMYRCYLGEDNVSDFSICRNCRYDLTMNFTDEGFVMDSWKVVRGDNWVDTRTLYFVDDPYVIYPGTAAEILVHYNRTSSSTDISSSGTSAEWVYKFDEAAMKNAGLTCTFMGEEKIKGRNGYDDYYFKVTASANAKVGASFPLKVRLKDGSKSDMAEIRIAKAGNLVQSWDFCPRYVAQTGELSLTGAVGSALPLEAKISNDSVLECIRTGDASFRFTALGAGRSDIRITSADGSQSLDMTLNVSAPKLKISDVDIALSPDGEKGRLDYHYVDDAGAELSHIDESAYMKYLKPVVSGCDYVAADVTQSCMDVYIDKLYSSGRLLNVGSYYQISIMASQCQAAGVHSMRAYVVDPFDGMGTLSVGAVDDYTLFGLSGVPAKVRKCFSSRLSEKLDASYDIPPVDASDAYVTSSLTPVGLDVFSNENGVYASEYKHSDSQSSEGASIRIWQKNVDPSTSHSAGTHELKLHVKNRYSGESISKVIARFDVYVHTAIGAASSFGFIKCNAPYGGGGSPTAASVYNSLAQMALYDVNSSDRIYYMDVSIEYLTPVDKVHVFDALAEDVVTGYNRFDGLDWVRPSRSDGTLDLNQRLLYSVCQLNDQRIVICDEPHGFRKGVGTLLYRALTMTQSSTALSEARLMQMFMGYSSSSGGLASFAPAYEMHDMNVSADMTMNIVSKNRPYYFSPKSCSGYRDSSGRGYHVIHTLDALVPSSYGWVHLL